MNQPNEVYNPFDPTGMFKGLRDSGMDAWSKLMIQFVNTEAYAQATAAALDAWLGASVPFRKAVETAMTQALTNFNMPTRGDVTALAERLTQIEMRLDDLEARLEESQRVARKAAGPKAKPNKGENPQ